MNAKDLILPEIPCLTPDTTVAQGLAMMQSSHRSTLPVVDGSIYAGVIHVDELMRDGDSARVGCESLRAPSVRGESHLLDVINQFAQYNDDVLPVTDMHRRYLGAIPICGAVDAMARLCHTSTMGAIIELDVAREDYSATELSRLVEDNNCRVMNLMVSPDDETGRWRVCLRIDREDASAVMRSLERFNYRVMSCHQLQGVMDERMEQRIKELMYYLEI